MFSESQPRFIEHNEEKSKLNTVIIHNNILNLSKKKENIINDK